ncbi:MAG: hypothetical protein M1313_02735 [Nitrospirae bacterium]|nr:hypothetical protein [Nitrospirota bacterium]
MAEPTTHYGKGAALFRRQAHLGGGWHTQGSGKSLSMTFYAGKEDPILCSVVGSCFWHLKLIQ